MTTARPCGRQIAVAQWGTRAQPNSREQNQVYKMLVAHCRDVLGRDTFLPLPKGNRSTSQHSGQTGFVVTKTGLHYVLELAEMQQGRTCGLLQTSGLAVQSQVLAFLFRSRCVKSRRQMLQFLVLKHCLLFLLLLMKLGHYSKCSVSSVNLLFLSLQPEPVLACISWKFFIP